MYNNYNGISWQNQMDGLEDYIDTGYNSHELPAWFTTTPASYWTEQYPPERIFRAIIFPTLSAVVFLSLLFLTIRSCLSRRRDRLRIQLLEAELRFLRNSVSRPMMTYSDRSDVPNVNASSTNQDHMPFQITVDGTPPPAYCSLQHSIVTRQCPGVHSITKNPIL